METQLEKKPEEIDKMEKEEMLNKKIEEVRKKNQTREKKFKEAEEDRRRAEREGCSVTLKPLPTNSSNDFSKEKGSKSGRLLLSQKEWEEKRAKEKNTNKYLPATSEEWKQYIMDRDKEERLREMKEGGEGKEAGKSVEKVDLNWKENNKEIKNKDNNNNYNNMNNNNYNISSKSGTNAKKDIKVSEKALKYTAKKSQNDLPNAKLPPPDPSHSFLADSYRDFSGEGGARSSRPHKSPSVKLAGGQYRRLSSDRKSTHHNSYHNNHHNTHQHNGNPHNKNFNFVFYNNNMKRRMIPPTNSNVNSNNTNNHLKYTFNTDHRLLITTGNQDTSSQHQKQQPLLQQQQLSQHQQQHLSQQQHHQQPPYQQKQQQNLSQQNQQQYSLHQQQYYQQRQQQPHRTHSTSNNKQKSHAKSKVVGSGRLVDRHQDEQTYIDNINVNKNKKTTDQKPLKSILKKSTKYSGSGWKEDGGRYDDGSCRKDGREKNDGWGTSSGYDDGVAREFNGVGREGDEEGVYVAVITTPGDSKAAEWIEEDTNKRNSVRDWLKSSDGSVIHVDANDEEWEDVEDDYDDSGADNDRNNTAMATITTTSEPFQGHIKNNIKPVLATASKLTELSLENIKTDINNNMDAKQNNNTRNVINVVSSGEEAWSKDEILSDDETHESFQKFIEENTLRVDPNEFSWAQEMDNLSQEKKKQLGSQSSDPVSPPTSNLHYQHNISLTESLISDDGKS